jgi:putative two-component system response regulator
LKPGKLEASERRLMELHPRIGSDCLAAIEARLGENGFLNLASEICTFHHEKWDGTGYPYGVAGASIPLSARIVAIADVYDALRSRRPYKEPLSHERACQFIEQGRGSHFDPQLVDAFLRIESEFRAASAAFSSQQSSEAINGAGNRLPNAGASSVVCSSVLTVRTSQSRRSKDIPMDLARA